MTLSIDDLRAAFAKNDNEGSSRPNNYYPFWNIAEGTEATVRFLPDANEDNTKGFLVEKLMHTLTINGEVKSVPCRKMFGEECPICKVSSAYYKDEDKANGKKYWRKKQHLAQVLVMEDPLPPDDVTGETHEGKVRFIAIGFQLYNIIKHAFERGELDEIPYSFKDGTNFIITKTKQGEYPSYSLSNFSRRSSSLTDEEISEATEHMIDLSTLLPHDIGLEKTEAMLEAALTGADYNSDSDSGSMKFVKRETVVVNAAEPATKKEATKGRNAASKKVEDPVDEDGSSGDMEDEAERILAQLQKRRSKKAS